VWGGVQIFVSLIGTTSLFAPAPAVGNRTTIATRMPRRGDPTTRYRSTGENLHSGATRTTTRSIATGEVRRRWPDSTHCSFDVRFVG
jgi:hypothetical protein